VDAAANEHHAARGGVTVFNLDNALKEWVKTLRRNPGFEDGYIEELRSHVLDEVDFLVGQGKSEQEAFETAIANIGPVDGIGVEYYKTNTRRLVAAPPWQPGGNKLGLLYNYFKIAVRKLKRHKGYSLVNILGLGIGITCFIFILLHVKTELSYDNYHEDGDRVYRVARGTQFKSSTRLTAGNSPMLAKTLKDNFPEVERAARLLIWKSRIIKYKDRVYYDTNSRYADPELFKTLAIPFIQGDPETALDRPNTAVLSRETAKRYFGDENPVGKTITIDDKDFEITGILKDPPVNTHYKYGIITSLSTLKDDEHINKWDMNYNAYTYIKLAPGSDAGDFENRIRRLAHDYIGEKLKAAGVVCTYFLQPLKDIHLHSHLNEESEPPGSLMNLTIFLAVGILILLIAGMNFINLSTANYANRAAEVGIRKVIGGQRRQLIFQFLGESLLISFLALISAVFMFLVVCPYLNDIAGTHFSGGGLLQPDVILILAGLGLSTGFMAGIYPSFFLSRFKPISVLRGVLRIGSKGLVLRKILVLTQFVISISLIIGTIAVYKQIGFMKSRDPGFDKEKKLVVRFPREVLNKDNYKTVKNEFLNHSSISGAALSTGVPGRWIYKWMLYPAGEQATNTQVVHCMGIDVDYIPLYGLTIIAGRDFKEELGTDTPNRGYILNEAAVKIFGWDSPEEAVGKGIFNDKIRVIGVLKDFHFMGLQNKIEPLGLFLMGEDYRYITLNTDMENTRGTIAFIEKTYGKFFPGSPLEYFFMDEDFDLQYRAEEQFNRLFRIFTILGIFIACLGIFGLSTYMAEQRTKEIGIRKVFGARYPGAPCLGARRTPSPSQACGKRQTQTIENYRQWQ